MLLGLGAALIPLLVHLFDRRRPRPQPFPPLSFVLRSQRRTASRLKLRRLILYALRTFLFVAFPIALARPELRRSSPLAPVEHGPAATALVLDASLSMRYRDGDSLFQVGRAEARAALSGLLPSEPATLVVCSGEPGPRRAPTLDRTAVLAELDAAQPSYAAVDMTRCLLEAGRALEDSPLPAKRLVIISDFTAAAFRVEAPLPVLTGPDGRPVRPSVVLRDVAPRHSVLPNHSLAGLKVEAAPQVGPRAYQFTFIVRNDSPEPARDLTVQLRLGNEVVARSFLDVPAGGRVQKVLTHRFQNGGVVEGEVSLTPDGLAEDDRQAFVLQVPDELRALLINGAPSTVRQRDEAFFLEAALRAHGSPVILTVRDAEAAWREDFSHYALIMLLNVEAPSTDVRDRLQRFVENGGGLFIALGDRVQPDTYNAHLGSLLPRPLRLLKSAVRPGETEGAAHLAEVDSRHPVFSPFTGPAQEGLTSGRFFRYFLLEARGEGANNGRVLAAFEDGAPALVEAQRGKGRIALWTSTVDRDWSDLPIRTAFLPLMQRLSAYLSRSLEEREALRPHVGERVELEVPAGTHPARLRAPSGAQLSLAPDGEGVLVTPPLPEPGVYEVLGSNAEALSALDFAAILDPAESDLTRLPLDSLARAWGHDVVVTSAQHADRAPVPLWTWLFVAAAVALLGEGLILRRA
jgi:hypothetical protein